MTHIISKGIRIALRCPRAVEELKLHLERNRVPDTDCQITWGERRIPLSRSRHHGGYVSVFEKQPVLRVESELERQVLKVFAAASECIALATQPITARFRFAGRVRRYTPDVLLVLASVPVHWKQAGIERFTLVEVKPIGAPQICPDLWAARCTAVRDALAMPLVRFPLQGGQ